MFAVPEEHVVVASRVSVADLHALRQPKFQLISYVQIGCKPAAELSAWPILLKQVCFVVRGTTLSRNNNSNNSDNIGGGFKKQVLHFRQQVMKPSALVLPLLFSLLTDNKATN